MEIQSQSFITTLKKLEMAWRRPMKVGGGVSCIECGEDPQLTLKETFCYFFAC